MRPADVLDRIDHDRLSPRAKWTRDNIVPLKVDEELSSKQIAERLNEAFGDNRFTRRIVSELVDELAGEMRAQIEGGVLPEKTPDEFTALKESIRELGQLVPIVIDPRDGTILDGRHRTRAVSELQAEGVDIQPWIVPLDDPQADPRTLTLTIGLSGRHLSRDQITRILEAEIIRDPKRSDNSIGKLLGVAHTTVGRARKRLLERGDIERYTKRVDSLGRTASTGRPPVEQETIQPDAHDSTAHNLHGEDDLLAALNELIDRATSGDATACGIVEHVANAVAAIRPGRGPGRPTVDAEDPNVVRVDKELWESVYGEAFPALRRLYERLRAADPDFQDEDLDTALARADHALSA